MKLHFLKVFSIVFTIIFFATIASIIFLQIYANLSTSIALYPYQRGVFVQFKNGELFAGNKVIGQFTAKDDFLSGIGIRFETFRRINSDVLKFRIKEANQAGWRFENTLHSKEFSGNPLYTIKIPTISDSRGKTYIFEIESLYGKPGDAVSIGINEPIIKTKHIFIRWKTDKVNIPTFFNLFIIFFLLLSFLFYRYAPKFPYFNLPESKKILAILLFGFLLRIFLASSPSFNFDMENFMIDAKIFEEGKMNVYLYQHSYNYSPAIFYIIGLISLLNKYLFFLPYPFFHRMFVSLFDLAIAIFLYKLSKIKNISSVKTVSIFFLNPASIILSAYYAQFEYLALFFIFAGIYLFYKKTLSNRWRQIIIWLSLTIGLIIKHNVLFQIFLSLMHIFGKNNKKKGFVLFGLSIILFLITFTPFYGQAKYEIDEYVFRYQGLATLSGFTGILYQVCPKCSILDVPLYTLYKYVFILASFGFGIFLSKKINLLRSLLLSTLFFLTFTSAHAATYFILPIPFGALFPTKSFYLYSLLLSLFLLGNVVGVKLNPYLTVIQYYIIWISASIWFLSELAIINKPARLILSIVARYLWQKRKKTT